MTDRYLIVTCMKNEGPFLLEWLAFHRAIGFTDILVYTNDCDDGTDLMLDRLARLGQVIHRDNTKREGQRNSYQIRAFRAATKELIYTSSQWVALIDADEFINIHVGDKSVQALTAEAEARVGGRVDAISLPWRLFGNGGVEGYNPGFVIQKFTRAAPHYCPAPMQAWGMKSIHRPESFERLGPHRPRVPKNEDWGPIKWVNAAGEDIPESYRPHQWRFDRHTISYDMGQINHYGVRSTESFLMKQAKGRVHGGQAIDLSYWNKMNRNEEEDRSILALRRSMRQMLKFFSRDPVLMDLHEQAVAKHRADIEAAKQTDIGRELLVALSQEAPSND
ncbi:hypothetical protein FHS89_001937 [Rubricella aquisinus]|uniref:Glycosyl transferase family 2 n=1 Tax=Rubricella aquisinus TaxID=2028108 RepID=A0A840X5D9_9RHOB|nr:hypothetical protein [Rubricella aquisinus]